MEKFFGINYEDPGTITKFENEAEIEKLGWLGAINEGLADAFKLEVTATREPLLRKAIIDGAEIDDGEEADTETELTIADWELVI